VAESRIKLMPLVNLWISLVFITFSRHSLVSQLFLFLKIHNPAAVIPLLVYLLCNVIMVGELMHSAYHIKKKNDIPLIASEHTPATTNTVK